MSLEDIIPTEDQVMVEQAKRELAEASLVALLLALNAQKFLHARFRGTDDGFDTGSPSM